MARAAATGTQFIFFTASVKF